MSEFHVEVVRIGPVVKHPNADTLSITKIHGGYPVIVRTGDYREGDCAVYVPVDAVVPTSAPPFAFLATAGRTAERIKAKRLRGVFSTGLLVPAPNGSVLGSDMAEALGVTKYEPPDNLTMGADAEPGPPGPQIPVYDIEGLRKYGHLLAEGEPVVITEKLHGANARVFHDGTRLWVGSRVQWKRKEGDGLWWPAVEQYAEALARHPNMVVYGEVFGQVQDLKYGVTRGARFAAFDVWKREDGTWLDSSDALRFQADCGMTPVPPLYVGQWSAGLASHAEGRSTLADHVREGFVVKPEKERRSDEIGRVILKLHGEGYLTRKGG